MKDPNDYQIWEKYALDSMKVSSPIFSGIAALLLALGVASKTNPTIGIGVAVTGLSVSYSRSMKVGKQHDFMLEHQSYCLSLDETLLKEYIRCYGEEHTKAEIQSAIEMGVSVSIACQEFSDGDWDKRVKRIAPALISPQANSTQNPSQPGASVRDIPLSIQTQNVTEYIPQSKREWSIDDMVSEVDNRLILGLKGSGKSVLVGKMLEIVRSKFPGKRIFVIDPKADPNERDIYRFANEVHSGNIGEMNPAEGLKFIKDGFDKYMKHPEPGLLILDEAIMIGGCMSDNKSNYLESKLRYVVAGGDSRGLNCWLISQSPMLTDLGLKTGVSSQLNLTIITTKNSLPNIKAWSGGSLMNGVIVEDALPAIDTCLIPKGRAILAGGFWYPMPIIETTWNRDDRTMNPVSNPLNPPEPVGIASNSLNPVSNVNPISNPISNPVEPNLEPNDREILERAFKLGSVEPSLDNALLEFFSCAKNLVPKSVRELRKIRSIASTGASPEQVKERLDYLTANGRLIQKEKGWILPEWNIEDLN
jgi:hypothetical protein